VLDPGEVSGVRSTVTLVDSSDVVDPNDAVLQELLAQIAENTQDKDKREKIIDLIQTLPPITQWPPEIFDEWRKTHDYIRGLRRHHELRQFKRMLDDGDIE
jgi:hypothetical protein